MRADTGLLIVRAGYRAGGLHDIRVDLTRPPVTRLFIGQLPDAVTKTVPYLFTLCAHAQRAAAQAAVTAALGEAPRSFDSVELWLEVLHENFWRLLLDWPPALGLRPEKDAFIAWRNARQGGNCLGETEKLLRHSLRPLAGKCLEMLVDRSTEEVAPDYPEIDTLPSVELAPRAWLEYWQGTSSHMPALTRPASILGVYRARLAETEAAFAALASGATFPVAGAGDDGWGVGQTLTARGVLTHAVHVVEGAVANYRVQAPTDSFFADATALSALLAGLRFVSLEQAKLVLNQAVLALDPCVPHIVECSECMECQDA